jgi:hypothetical protein
MYIENIPTREDLESKIREIERRSAELSEFKRAYIMCFTSEADRTYFIQGIEQLTFGLNEDQELVARKLGSLKLSASLSIAPPVLKPFSAKGDTVHRNFTQFKRQFDQYVFANPAHANKILWFQILLQYVLRPALNLIQHLLYADESFDSAITILENEYKNDHACKQNLMRDLRELQPSIQ